MRLEPRHLERGEEAEMAVEAAASRTPAKSSWLSFWNGKKHECEVYCLSQVENSYLTFRKGGKFVMSCQELSSWDIHVILWCCKLRPLQVPLAAYPLSRSWCVNSTFWHLWFGLRGFSYVIFDIDTDVEKLYHMIFLWSFFLNHSYLRRTWKDHWRFNEMVAENFLSQMPSAKS